MIQTFLYKIKKQPYLFLFAKIALLIIIVFVVDYTAGAVLRHYYFKQKSGVLYRTTYVMDSTNAQVLILGSSKASHHYYPAFFEERLKMSYYNGGRDGTNILNQYAILKSVLKRYKPEIVVLDFTTKDFIVSQQSYDRLSSLLPYYKTHPEIRPVADLRSPFEKYKLLSNIYPYNSAPLVILNGNVGKGKKEVEINGYLPLFRKMEGPMKPDLDKDITALDTVKVNVYEDFIKDCQAAGVRLYIFCSPAYIQYVKRDIAIETAAGIAKKYNVPFYNFINTEPFTKSPQLFFDKSHLNDEGAQLYTSKVIDAILEGGEQAR